MKNICNIKSINIPKHVEKKANQFVDSILLPLEMEENEMYEEKFKMIKSKLDEIDTTDSMDYDDFLKKNFENE